MPEVKWSETKGCGSQLTLQKSVTVTQKIAFLGCNSGWFWKPLEALGKKFPPPKKIVVRQIRVFDLRLFISQQSQHAVDGTTQVYSSIRSKCCLNRVICIPGGGAMIM